MNNPGPGFVTDADAVKFIQGEIPAMVADVREGIPGARQLFAETDMAIAVYVVPGEIAEVFDALLNMMNGGKNPEVTPMTILQQKKTNPNAN